MNSAFAFLDSNFEIPQHLQMLVFNNFANKNNISISFYGNETWKKRWIHDLEHSKGERWHRVADSGDF